MKTIALISILGLATLSCAGQKVKEADVPANVKQAFQKQYPNVKVSEWEKEQGNFEAEFEKNKVETSVLIDAQGKILETEVEIQISELPAAVKEYVSKNH